MHSSFRIQGTSLLGQRRFFFLDLCLLCLIALIGGLSSGGAGGGATPPASIKATGTIQTTLAHLPLYFLPNQGHLDPRVRYYLSGGSTQVYFTPEGLTLALMEARDQVRGHRARLHPVTFDPTEAGAPVSRWAVQVGFLGANPEVTPIGEDPTPAKVSYFTGPETQWKTGLPTYQSVRYPNLWPGIDLVYSGTSGRLKYTFLLQPGADPTQIQLVYRGATQVTLASTGVLDITTPVAGITSGARWLQG